MFGRGIRQRLVWHDFIPLPFIPLPKGWFPCSPSSRPSPQEKVKRLPRLGELDAPLNDEHSAGIAMTTQELPRTDHFNLLSSGRGKQVRASEITFLLGAFASWQLCVEPGLLAERAQQFWTFG